MLSITSRPGRPKPNRRRCASGSAAATRASEPIYDHQRADHHRDEMASTSPAAARPRLSMRQSVAMRPQRGRSRCQLFGRALAHAARISRPAACAVEDSRISIYPSRTLVGGAGPEIEQDEVDSPGCLEQPDQRRRERNRWRPEHAFKRDAPRQMHREGVEQILDGIFTVERHEFIAQSRTMQRDREHAADLGRRLHRAGSSVIGADSDTRHDAHRLSKTARPYPSMLETRRSPAPRRAP